VHQLKYIQRARSALTLKLDKLFKIFREALCDVTGQSPDGHLHMRDLQLSSNHGEDGYHGLAPKVTKRVTLAKEFPKS
jgi:hypothetical protein